MPITASRADCDQAPKQLMLSAGEAHNTSREDCLVVGHRSSEESLSDTSPRTAAASAHHTASRGQLI